MSLALINGSIQVSGKTLLDRVSIDCAVGEFVVIVGENGAGKTTLLNALAGISSLSSGSALLAQREISDYSNLLLARRRAVLPQSVELNFPLDAAEVVRLAMSLSNLSQADQDRLIANALELFKVSHLAHRNYLYLSGGERQRIQLARVVSQIMANQECSSDSIPEQFLLLDEPISALDLHQQYSTLHSLKKLCKDRALGVVAILHDLNLTAQFADKIIVLKEGCLACVGSPSDVISEQMLKDSFNVDAVIQNHPETQQPMIIPKMALS